MHTAGEACGTGGSLLQEALGRQATHGQACFWGEGWRMQAQSPLFLLNIWPPNPRYSFKLILFKKQVSYISHSEKVVEVFVNLL